MKRPGLDGPVVDRAVVRSGQVQEIDNHTMTDTTAAGRHVRS
jgi:hypothetical protein